ncbi:MAG: HesA/MoeB/ThiF family protein [Saprospiraceae bacterium]|nr:HesA/MoeB/ThiF family protein [Saprospiraceae bacterium]
MNRFNRQEILPQVGSEGQLKLKASSVLVIGAGGLSCPALLYLAAAGVGKLGIVDGDSIALSNLNRQVLFGMEDLQKNKAIVAATKLKSMYSDLEILDFPFFINQQNAFELIPSFDFVLDGSDNFETRYLVNDACFILGKPWVYGSIYRMQGQIACFNVSLESGRSCNYRDIYPQISSENKIPNCAEAGVLGVVPGLIGSFQAAEILKLILNLKGALINKLMIYDFETHGQQILEIEPDQNIQKLIPANETEFGKMDYSAFCQSDVSLDWNKALEFSENKLVNVLWLDVREPGETPMVDQLNFTSLPFSQFNIKKLDLFTYDYVFVYCQSGFRSQKVVNDIKGQWPGKNIFSMKGGVLEFPVSKN